MMEVILQKLQQEYLKNKSPKLEADLNDAKKTTGAIRRQLEALTDQPVTVSYPVTVSHPVLCLYLL